MAVMNENWKISSHSASGANCVEARGPWRKSSRSYTQETCVEVAPGCAKVLVRDSKDRGRAHFAVGVGSWAAFVTSLRT